VEEVITRASEAKGPFPGGKRVGSRGKKKKKKKKEKGEGRAPADLHPPLIVDKGVWPLLQAQGLVPFSKAPIWFNWVSPNTLS
jgi:hypothetical protein